MKTKADVLAFFSFFFVMMGVAFCAHPDKVVGTLASSCLMLLGLLAGVGALVHPQKRNTFNAR